MNRSVQIQGIAIFVLLIIAFGVWHAALREDRKGILTVSFLDVGQGDAIFIDAPSGRQVLIDGGKARAVLRQLSRVMPWYDRSIDVVVATHPDADHIGGLPDVLKRYRVERVFYSSVDDDGSDQRAFMDALEEEVRGGAEKLIARRGQILVLGGGAYVEILFPDRSLPGIETNTGSIIARLVYAETAFMLTGDSPQSIEKYLVQLDGSTTLTTSANGLKANVLKVGHHGSKTSSSPLFVGFVSPEYAVFSRGCDNSYGHPHPEVVALFERFEIPTLDTCKDGLITFVSDGIAVHRK